MEHTRAIEVATSVANELATGAGERDKRGSFDDAAVAMLAKGGLLALLVPADRGGAGLGPRAFADVLAKISEADASVGMVYMMHLLGVHCVTSSKKSAMADAIVRDVVAGKHLSTLALSEAGSRSHFWAPVSRAEKRADGVRLNAQKSWVTSAGHAQSYIVSSLAADAKTPVESNLYLVRGDAPGFAVAGRWDGLGLRANGSAPMRLEGVDVTRDAQLTEECKGFDAMMSWVLPLFALGSAAVSLGLCRAALGATVSHLKNAKFEHMGSVSLGEALPNLRARLAQMQIATDGLAVRIADTVDHLEKPGDLTMLKVLQVKAAAGDVVIDVTQTAMRACGGAAFSKHTQIERFFRDAQAGAVMAPTVDVLHDFIGKALLGLPLF